MPLPTGTVYFSQIRTEMSQGAGGGYTGTMPMNDATFRSRLTDTGQNSTLYLSSIRGNAYQRFTIGANYNSTYNIYNALRAAGWNGVNKGSVDVIINGGVVVSSSTTGDYGVDTGGGWPGPSTVYLYNYGYINGMGGNGGAGGRSRNPGNGGPLPGNPGAGGGPALRAQRSLVLVNGGIIAGGGGGGGGGGGKFTPSTTGANPTNTSVSNGGGGGGGGRTGATNSAGGANGGAVDGQNQGQGQPGAAGTFSGAGAGGQGGSAAFNPGAPDGGAGGDWGTAGAAGQTKPGSDPSGAGGAAGISVQGWSVVSAPTGGAGLYGPVAG